MALIQAAIPYIFQNEGGLTHDSGGITNLGLTKRDLAAFYQVPIGQVSDEEIKELDAEEATEIYYRLYWQKMNLDGVYDDAKATAIFDIGVNRGITIGAKYAQKAASLCGRRDTVDGIIGGLSLSAINAVERKCFIEHLEAFSWAGYQAIVAHDPAKYSIYLRGWEIRARRLLTLI